MVADLGTNVGDPRARLEAVQRSTRGEAPAAHAAARAPRHASCRDQRSYILACSPALAVARPSPSASASQTSLAVGAAVLQRLAPRRDLPGLVVDAWQRAQHHVRELRGHTQLRPHRARDTLPHLQRLAIYLGEAVDELAQMLLGTPRPAIAAPRGTHPSGERRGPTAPGAAAASARRTPTAASARRARERERHAGGTSGDGSGDVTPPARRQMSEEMPRPSA